MTIARTSMGSQLTGNRMKKGGKVSEYGGMETYTSEKARKKHEKAEGWKVERKEKAGEAQSVKKSTQVPSKTRKTAAKKSRPVSKK